MPTGPLTSKHVTSGTTRETTPATTTNNNNNNSPPSESPASYSTDVSRGSSDVTDQSARVKPSPAGKRARKGTSSGGRAARALPGPGDVVDSAGATRRAAPVAGKLSVSATSSPVSVTAGGGGTVMPENNSSRKQTALTTMSTSLTNVAAKTEPGGSPELVRRKATTSSRLAVPRAPGRLPKAPRPASDGGGTTAGSASHRGLGSKLPSAVSGSVGAISDGIVQANAHKQQQQHSLKSDHPARPVVSTSSSSSSSPGRLSELRVRFGLTHDTQHVVAADLPSPTTRTVPAATCGSADDMECLPVGQSEIPDRQKDQQSLSQNRAECQNVADWQKNHRGLVDSHGYGLNVSDWQSQSDEKILRDRQEQHQNTEENQCHDQNSSDGQPSHGISLTVPYEQENHHCLTDMQNDCDKNHRNLSDEDRDPESVPVDLESRGHSDSDEQFVMCQGREVICNTALTYRDVERMTSARDDDVDTVSRETSCQLSDVILASSVVTTTADTTGTTYNHSTSVSGKYAVIIQVKFIAGHPGVRQAFCLYLYANLGFVSLDENNHDRLYLLEVASHSLLFEQKAECLRTGSYSNEGTTVISAVFAVISL